MNQRDQIVQYLIGVQPYQVYFIVSQLLGFVYLRDYRPMLTITLKRLAGVVCQGCELMLKRLALAVVVKHREQLDQILRGGMLEDQIREVGKTVGEEIALQLFAAVVEQDYLIRIERYEGNLIEVPLFRPVCQEDYDQAPLVDQYETLRPKIPPLESVFLHSHIQKFINSRGELAYSIDCREKFKQRHYDRSKVFYTVLQILGRLCQKHKVRPFNTEEWITYRKKDLKIRRIDLILKGSSTIVLVDWKFSVLNDSYTLLKISKQFNKMKEYHQFYKLRHPTYKVFLYLAVITTKPQITSDRSYKYRLDQLQKGHLQALAEEEEEIVHVIEDD